MAKTRSQTLTSVFKKEKHEDEYKLKKEIFHGTNNATKSKIKITKNRTLTQAQIIKVKPENVDDNKALLASPKKKTLRRSKITAEKIAKLIGYVVNDKASVTAAAKKAGISQPAALNYYREYQDDPEHRIPLPKTQLNKPLSIITQDKIDKLIRYILNDGINVTQASKKADVGRPTATKYYAKYLDDPERKIPLLADHTGDFSKRYTQKEIADLIGYIVRDNLTFVEASKKANMSYSTAKRYYLKYLDNPNHDIPDPHESNQRCGIRFTNDQVSTFIGYIENDGMSLSEASFKVNMSKKTASKYYRQYLDDPEKNIPTPENNNSRVSNNPATLDQIKDFFCYVIVDKLKVAHAARRAKIAESTGYLYYNEYLKNPNNQARIKDMSYSTDKMKRLVELVQNEKLSVATAAGIVHLCKNVAGKHYQQYLKNPQYEFPAIKNKQYTQEDIKRLIDCVERGKMRVLSAARKIEMKPSTAYRYYKEYQNDPEHKIPVPIIRGLTRKSRELGKYTRIIDDIYKNNPSIKPIYQIHDPELDGSDIKIKKELMEEDTKAALKTGNS